MLQTMAYGGSLRTELFENVSRQVSVRRLPADILPGLCIVSISPNAIRVRFPAQQRSDTNLTDRQIRRLDTLSIILRFCLPRRLFRRYCLRLRDKREHDLRLPGGEGYLYPAECQLLHLCVRQPRDMGFPAGHGWRLHPEFTFEATDRRKSEWPAFVGRGTLICAVSLVSGSLTGSTRTMPTKEHTSSLRTSQPKTIWSPGSN